MRQKPFTSIAGVCVLLVVSVFFVSTDVFAQPDWVQFTDETASRITASADVSISDTAEKDYIWGDIDNDGDADLYATTVRGGNMLFENKGNGKFEDISKTSGLDYIGHSSGAVFFDYDRDGLLDVFLTNVGRYTSDEIKTVTMEQVRGEQEAEYKFYGALPDAFAGHIPEKKRSERSILYKNLGNNRFEDVSEKVKLERL